MVEIGSSDDSAVPHVTNLREQEIHSSVPGLCIFSVSIGETADSLPLVSDAVSGSDQNFHKVFPGFKTPFWLSYRIFPSIRENVGQKTKSSGCTTLQMKSGFS